MTQQIEPLKLQRRTNIEEHMQFFTKINEIVGAYKATVDLVDSLTPEIRNLLAALEGYRAEILNLKDFKDSASGSIATLNETVDLLKGKIGQCVKTVGQSTQQIEGYRAEILNLKDFKDSASGSIATLNETVDLLKGKIGQCVKTVGQSTQQIEGSLHLNDGDFTADNVTALETIDADTLQAHALNVIDTAVVPDTANGSVSQYAVNAKRLMEEPSIVRTTGNQTMLNTKQFQLACFLDAGNINNTNIELFTTNKATNLLRITFTAFYRDSLVLFSLYRDAVQNWHIQLARNLYSMESISTLPFTILAKKIDGSDKTSFAVRGSTGNANLILFCLGFHQTGSTVSTGSPVPSGAVISDLSGYTEVGN